MNAAVAGKKETRGVGGRGRGEGYPGSNIAMIPKRIHSEGPVKFLKTSAAL